MNVIRRYTSADRTECLGLFQGNVPEFFAASDRNEFDLFLEREAVECLYYVVAQDGRVAACGGQYFDDDGETASLCWGMVDRKLQGAGLGTKLTEARLSAARTMPGIKQVRLGTSQHTQGFYARFGFEVQAITKDGYGPGLDRWDLLLQL